MTVEIRDPRPMFDYLTGIYNITPTPFKPDGTLDEPSLPQADGVHARHAASTA